MSRFRPRKTDARIRRLFVEQLEGRQLLASVNWDGAPNGGGVSVDNKWRTGSNWAGDQVYSIPISDIEFPVGAANLSNFNDYGAGSLIGSILLSGSGYTLQGNAITMGAGNFTGLTSTIPAGTSNTISLPIALAIDQTWTSTTAGSTLDMSGGAVDLRGSNLTVDGNGTTILGPITDSTDVGGNNGIIAESGTVVLSGDSTAAIIVGVHDATLQVLGSATQTFIDMNGGTLTTDAAATTGPINVLGFDGGRIAPGGVGTAGILSTQGSVLLSGLNGFGTSLAIDLNGTTVGSGYDALHVTGTATLGGILNLNPSSASTTGSTYTILTATGGVTSTFIGLNDLDKFTANGRTFQIDYTPDSVVLTDVTVEYVVNVNTDEEDEDTFDNVCDADLAKPGLQCTLRAAIQQANAADDSNFIKFNIPGTGVHTISPGSPAPVTHAAQVGDFFFAPQNITINAGDTVQWTWIGSAQHSVTSDTGVFDSGTHTNGFTFSQRFDTAGVFPYHCKVHSFMTGTITVVASPLPAPLPIITDPVTIDGYTQPGASPNTDPTGFNGKLLIELSGQNAGVATGLDLRGGSSIVRGLIVNSFQDEFSQGIGISFTGAGGNVIEGNFIGTNASGTAAAGNSTGVLVGLGANNNRIGGTLPAARNIISGNQAYGLWLLDTSDNVVQGNFVGTNPAGTSAVGNGSQGIAIDHQHDNLQAINLIGGTTAGSRNVLSGNGVGVAMSFGGGAMVQGNSIGTDWGGTLFLPNTYGISIDQSKNNMIGGTDIGAGNIVAFNSVTGATAEFAETGNYFLGNSFFGNGAGIQLTFPGPTANDPGDADTGPNNLQNFPEISYATRDAGKLKVTYKVPSAPANSTYPLRVEFFLAGGSSRQGGTYLGYDTFFEEDFTAGGKTVTFTTAAPLPVFDFITATAIDGPGNTSEFSPERILASPWQNPGPLRWDVDGSATVDATDVVNVINRINAKGSGPLPADAANQKPFYDVDGDNNVVASDVVAIINYINAGRPLGGEGEAADAAASDPMPMANVDVLSLLAAEMADQATKKRK